LTEENCLANFNPINLHPKTRDKYHENVIFVSLNVTFIRIKNRKYTNAPMQCSITLLKIQRTMSSFYVDEIKLK